MLTVAAVAQVFTPNLPTPYALVEQAPARPSRFFEPVNPHILCYEYVKYNIFLQESDVKVSNFSRARHAPRSGAIYVFSLGRILQQPQGVAVYHVRIHLGLLVIYMCVYFKQKIYSEAVKMCLHILLSSCKNCWKKAKG